MLGEKQIEEIRKQLELANNPLFIVDGDTDGLCSFLLFRKHIGIGKVIMLRDSPEVGLELLNRVEKLKPDRIFVLDKPIVSQEFIDAVNVPIIWIDHHQPLEREHVKYYNPRAQDIKDERSTSYWAYRVVKNDLWIAEMGIVADWRLDFIDEFSKQYPGLVDKRVKIAPDVLYNTKFGRLIKLVAFLLKGKQRDIINNIELMIKIKTPYELLNEESENGKKLMKYARKMEKLYDRLMEDAMNNKGDDRLFLFLYPNQDASFTGELSNELIYKMPEKFIIVAREKEDKIIMSLRSSNDYIPGLLEKALNGLDGRGGGHDHACGAIVSKSQFNVFISRLKRLI